MESLPRSLPLSRAWRRALRRSVFCFVLIPALSCHRPLRRGGFGPRAEGGTGECDESAQRMPGQCHPQMKCEWIDLTSYADPKKQRSSEESSITYMYGGSRGGDATGSNRKAPISSQERLESHSNQCSLAWAIRDASC